MNATSITCRRVFRDLARAGTVVSSAMLAVSILAALSAADPNAAAAGTNAGNVAIVQPLSAGGGNAPLASGAATDAFQLSVPVGASCAGDTATGGYHVQSYIVPATVDPGILTWNSTGPVPLGVGATLRLPLFSSTGTKFVNGATAIATGGSPTGLVTGLPDFSFGQIQSTGGLTTVPVGRYNMGIACTATGGVEEKYWNVQIDVTDVGGQIHWAAVAGTPTTTTTTTTTVAGTTTTVVGGTTTTTVRPTTTTTSTSTTTTVASGVLSSAGGSGGVLVSTGSSPTRLLTWAVLLLAFGRMAILFGRPIKVIPARR
jgi:hypothetical protein